MRITNTDSPEGAHDFGEHCPCSGCRAVRWARRRAFGWASLAGVILIPIGLIIGHETQNAFLPLLAVAITWLIYRWRKPKTEILEPLVMDPASESVGNPTPEVDVMAMADEILAEDEKIGADLEAQLKEINAMSAEDRALFEWLMALPEEHKQIVDACAARGIRVTPDNFDEILERLGKAKAQ